MFDRTEALYMLGEIERVRPSWEESQKRWEQRVKDRKAEVERAKKALADAQTELAEKRSYLAGLDEKQELYTKALDDLVDEYEATRILKANQAFYDHEAKTYYTPSKSDYEDIRKAAYTVGCTISYDRLHRIQDDGRYYLELDNIPDSYREFIEGSKDDDQDPKR